MAPLRALGEKLRPGTRSLAVAQDRAVEKQFIEECGGRVASWRAVDSLDDVRGAVAELGVPLVLKTRRYGYDGKGQAWIRALGDANRLGRDRRGTGGRRAGVRFSAEFSVIVARWADGRHAFWDRPRTSIATASFAGRPSRPEASWPRKLPKRARRPSHCRSARPCRRTHRRIFRERGRPVDQRDRPARAQQRSLDDRRRADIAVRAAHPRHLRSAAGIDRLVSAGATMDNLIGDDVESWPDLVASRARTCTSTGRAKHGRAARWDMSRAFKR